MLRLFDRIPPSVASLTIVVDFQVLADTFARHAGRATRIPTVACVDMLLFSSYFKGSRIVFFEALSTAVRLIRSSHYAQAVTPHTGIVLPGADIADFEAA